MNIKIKKSNGVTMIVLVITVVLLAILAGVTVTVSKESLLETKKYDFISKLETIQQKVLIVNKEIELGSTAYEDIGTKYEDLDSTKRLKVMQILEQHGVENYSDYIFLSSEDLLKIGLKNIEQNVIISNVNSVVYSYDGIEINGHTYYSIEEIYNI